MKLLNDYPGYAVDEQGNVYTLKREPSGELMKVKADKRGAHRVRLYCGGKAVDVYVHQLVLIAFKRKPEPGEVAQHTDGDYGNNALDNLDWVPRTPPKEKKLTEEEVYDIKLKILEGHPDNELARVFRVGLTTIRDIRKGKTWAHLEV